MPVLVTILEPPHESAPANPPDPGSAGKGNVAAVLALLRSPEFLLLPPSDPQEVEQRIQALRNDRDAP